MEEKDVLELMERLQQPVLDTVQRVLREQEAARQVTQRRLHDSEQGRWTPPPPSRETIGDNPGVSCETLFAEVRLFAGNYAPPGWASCEGQLLKIARHQALYSILGCQYGGDGRETFALPDLRGCIPMHPLDGRPGTPRFVGERSGGWPVAVEGNPDTAARTPTGLGMRYIIALQGIYPPRP